eukprot:3935817-Rhodomonas_salina.1
MGEGGRGGEGGREGEMEGSALWKGTHLVWDATALIDGRIGRHSDRRGLTVGPWQSEMTPWYTSSTCEYRAAAL